jgi:ribonuclease H2 subunit A
VGQGLVLGPIVYACVFSPRDKAADLIHYFDLRDNAGLKEHVRLQKYQVIKKLNYSRLGFFMKTYHPRMLSNEILRGDTNARENITTFSYKTIKKLLRLVLSKGFRVSMVYIGNCRSCFCGSIQSRFYKDFPKINFQFDRKSIHNIPVLSCASILARVYREECLWKWQFEEGKSFSKDFGLGTPHMAKTLQWLNE